jgi:hypothetical protein
MLTITVSVARRELPYLMPLRFHDEHNVLIEDWGTRSEMVQEMLALEGWRFLGWTHAEQVSSGGKPFTYLCMFERDDTRVWCHIPEADFISLAVRVIRSAHLTTPSVA